MASFVLNKTSLSRLRLKFSAVLKAKEKRLVRIIWKAKKKISHEIAYRISFTEKNVDVDFGMEARVIQQMGNLHIYMYIYVYI